MIKLNKTEYLVNLWDGNLKISFSPHSLFRAKKRGVDIKSLIQSVILCQERIKDMRHMYKRFVVLDYANHNAFICAFDNPCKLSIITVFYGTDVWIEGKINLITHTKKEIHRYACIESTTLH